MLQHVLCLRSLLFLGQRRKRVCPVPVEDTINQQRPQILMYCIKMNQFGSTGN